MANKSNTPAQTISTPQGGGALHGIGETFSPDLHTGTGNFTVPLTLPPGRNGFEPKLSLVYSTGNGNGPFGLGWNLTIPGVSRKTSKGIPRYGNETGGRSEPDTFILSGAEDLVAISETGGITQYRPRTEGLFARIEHYATAETNHWEVGSKDGLVSVYGTPSALPDDPATITKPETPTQIFSWKLTKTTDPFGNTIQYEYERDVSDSPDRQWDQVYLKRIKYADYSQVDTGGTTVEKFLVSISFVYEERPDPFSDHRAGFEIRTRRRCIGIEIRTHADQDRLARTYQLIYLDQRGLPDEQLPLNSVSLLSQVIVVGHDGEKHESLPQLEFGYTAFEPTRQRYQPFTGAPGSRPSRSLGHPEYELVDLFGRGMPDVLEFNGQARYWRNLGDGRFDLMRTIEAVPAGVKLSEPGVQLLDANGNGRADLMVIDGIRAGYFPLTFTGEWNPAGFVPYSKAPTINLDAPDVRLLDLDGDGITDALRTASQFEFYYNSPDSGWFHTERRERIDTDSFPNVTFEDPRVKVADITGDGLQDILRIHNGLLEYWPYQGYGRWGQRIVMRNSPQFEDAAFYAGTGYDPRRLLVGDVDGDGVADLIYVSSGHVTVWINQSGNAWSDPIVIHGTPPVTDASAVRLADMLGTGTDGILWTYDFGTFPDSTYKFLDLTGGVKPYVLDAMDNHMGALTKVSYASSTRFFTEDNEQPQTRWRTPLPFPVQVVARVETIDQLSRGKLTTEYRYHHGYWDGSEREFRGFGMVEQLDTETFSDYLVRDDGSPEFEPVPKKYFSPPVLSKTWFHQGPIDDEFGDWHELDLTSEYWPGDAQVLSHTETVNESLRSLTAPRHKRDALRTLRGSVLRTELYALDATAPQDRPYTVTEKSYGVREEIPPNDQDENRQRIFFPYLRAERTTQWERGEHPMTSFSFVDQYDPYGQSQRSVGLAVAHDRDYRVPAPAGQSYLGTVSKTSYAQRDDEYRYMVDRVCESKSFEVVNDGSQTVFELYKKVQDDLASLELIGQTFNYYDGEPFVGLPFKQLGEYGAAVRSESLVITEELLREAYSGDTNTNEPEVPPYLQPEGTATWPSEYPAEFRSNMTTLVGYTFADGSDHRARGYFATGSRLEFDFHKQQQELPARGLALTMRDPFDKDTSTDFAFQLLPIQVTDPIGLTTSAKYDYRVLQPEMVTDLNGNRSRVTFSPLGLVTSLAVMGKDGEPVGDTVEVPGNTLEYDFFAFSESSATDPQPVWVKTISRQHHVHDTDVPLPERDATITKVEYSDGFGRLTQTLTQAEDVLFGDQAFGRGVLPMDQSIPTGDTVGTLRNNVEFEPNVIVSGWQVYDNKGRVVEKYEPFFAAGWSYNANGPTGQKVTMFYDPRGQVIKTLNPDGSEQRVIYGIPADLTNPDQFDPTPWEAYTYDSNDLAPLSRDANGTFLTDRTPEAHHFTPSHIVIDALGRTIESVALNRHTANEAVEPIRTRTTYDIRGNMLTVVDALNRDAFSYTYDFANRPWRIKSIDAGLRRIVLNVVGNEIERRDSKGSVVLQGYDVLQRPSRLWARDDANADVTLRQRMEYGDSGVPNQPDREEMRAHNLLGQLNRHHDEAGLTTVERLDFKGNTTEKTRSVIADAPILAAINHGQANGWNIKPFVVDWQPENGQEFADREAELLDATAYQTTASFDALNRMKRLHLPEDAEGSRREWRPRYNRAGGLDQVWLDEALYVERIAYDAKGQRSLIAYGNGVMTRYAYDPLTFRLRRLRSERYSKPDELTYHPNGEVFQDFGYDHDLVGNIVTIRGRTPQSGFFSNPEALTTTDQDLKELLINGDALNRRFTYDAIYRLRSADGRECDVPPDSPWDDRPRCADVNRCRGYSEKYLYDIMGNLLQLGHHDPTSTNANGFTRKFTIELVNNRLSKMEIGSDPYDYKFDDNGNMKSETNTRHFEWNHSDQMKVFRTQTAGAEPSVYAQYLYEASGERVKKFVRKQNGDVEVTHCLDGVFEHHHWIVQSQSGENNHLHVMDDQQRIALVRIGPAHPDDRGPAIQFHLGDYLSSSNVVIDSTGTFMNREEFTPYGETSFGSFAKKRYRFTGKERDEESGLHYHGARYYPPWLVRWLSTDPAGCLDSNNLYQYVLGNPMLLKDSTGLQGNESDFSQLNGVVEETAKSSELGAALAQGPVPIPAATTNVDYAAEAKKGRSASSKANLTGAGEQQQHWTKERSSAKTRMPAAKMNENMSPLQSRGRAKGSFKTPPAKTLLTDYRGGGTKYQVDGGPKFGNEHKFADRHLIPAEEAKNLSTANPRNAVVESGQTARWRMTGEPGPGPGRTWGPASQASATPSKAPGPSAQPSQASKVGSELPRTSMKSFLRVGGVILEWMPVLLASDEGSAVFGLLIVQGCSKGPYVCALAGVLALNLEAGEQRQKMIDGIRNIYHDDPYGEEAESMIKASCLYASAACRQ